ncbi:MAG: DUF4097 family beta strand repeat-containing protein [Acidimicrobiales bacterium]|jgi:DUF4097 and DUF4098 domain-containing protein YvlB
MSNSRQEIYQASGPVHADVVTKSGDISVQMGSDNEVKVSLKASSSNAQALLENAELHFDEASNEIRIRTQPHDQFDSLAGLTNLFMKSLRPGDLDVILTLPEGSSIKVVTASGDTVTLGPLADVDVTTGSGDVRVGDTVNSVNVKTGSGDVVTGHVTESLECRCASGDVRCDGAASATNIHTASGDVMVIAERSGDISIRAVSGDVRINVRPGLVIDVSGTTVSGDMGSAIPLDLSSGDDDDDEGETVSINVVTVSGDFKISRAS